MTECTQDGNTIPVMAPRDAEGRKVPLDTKKLYDDEGVSYEVCELTYRHMTAICEAYWTVDLVTAENKVCQSSLDSMYLEKPDSLKQLIEDIERAQHACDHNGLHVAVCRYSGNNTCRGCDFRPDYSTCSSKMFRDIAARVNRLCGDSE